MKVDIGIFDFSQVHSYGSELGFYRIFVGTIWIWNWPVMLSKYVPRKVAFYRIFVTSDRPVYLIESKIGYLPEVLLWNRPVICYRNTGKSYSLIGWIGKVSKFRFWKFVGFFHQWFLFLGPFEGIFLKAGFSLAHRLKGNGRNFDIYRIIKPDQIHNTKSDGSNRPGFINIRTW